MSNVFPDDWTTTGDLPPLEGFFNQPQVVEALDMALGMVDKGFHCLLVVPEDIGNIRAVVKKYAQKFVREHWPDVPVYEYGYVLDFADLDSPQPLRLPRGKGGEFSAVMERAKKTIMKRIRQMFSGEWFQREFAAIGEEFARFTKSKKEEFEEVFAGACGVSVPFSGQAVGWSEAFFIVPALDIHAMDTFTKDFTPAMSVNISSGAPGGGFVVVSPYYIKEWLMRFPDLDEDKRAKLAERVVEGSPEITRRQKESGEKRTQFSQEVVRTVFDSVLGEAGYVAESYPEAADFVSGLREFFSEIIAENQDLIAGQELTPFIPKTANSILTAFTVNVLGDRGGLDTVPVIWEDDPTFLRMVGKVLEPERQMTPQGLVTSAYDHRSLRSGAILDANDGVLIFPLSGVDNITFKALEEALESGKFTIEDIGDRVPLSNHLGTGRFNPKPVPFNVRVVLVVKEGDHKMISLQNPTFFQSFRTMAKFATQTERTPENEKKVARFLRLSSNREGLLPCKREGAVPLFVDHLSRLTRDPKKLSLNMGALKDLHIQADYWARQDGATVITGEYVQKALDRQKSRTRASSKEIGFLRER